MRILFVGLFSLGILVLIGVIALPHIGRSRLIDAVRDDCGDCRFEVKRLETGFFPFRIKAENVFYSTGNSSETLIEIMLPKVVAYVSVSRLFRGQIQITEVEVIAPEFTVTEGDAKSPRSLELDPGKSAREVVAHLDRITVTEGRLNYLRLQGGQVARLKLTDIQGKIEIQGKMLQSQLLGVLEKSAQFEVDLKMPSTFLDSNLDVGLKISNLNLPELNSYFHPGEGLRLSGKMIRGESHVKIQDKHLEGSVQAEYLDLDVKFEKTKERSAVVAFFSNLRKSISLESESPKDIKENKPSHIGIERTSDEAVVHFIFRGMSKAAVRLVL